MEPTQEPRSLKRVAPMEWENQDSTKRSKVEGFPAQFNWNNPESVQAPGIGTGQLNFSDAVNGNVAITGEFQEQGIDENMEVQQINDGADVRNISGVQDGIYRPSRSVHFGQGDGRVENSSSELWPPTNFNFEENLRRQEPLALQIYQPDYDWPRYRPIYRIPRQNLNNGGEGNNCPGALFEPDC